MFTDAEKMQLKIFAPAAHGLSFLFGLFPLPKGFGAKAPAAGQEPETPELAQ